MKKLQFPITIKVIHEQDATDAPYVAYIPEFDVSSCGPSENVAVENVKQVLDILLDEVNREGHLENFLDELGFGKSNQATGKFPKIIIEPFVFSM